MRRIASSLVAFAAVLASAATGASTLYTLNTSFESPTFTVGNIGCCTVTGQGGWGGYNSVVQDGQLVLARIVNDRAWSGTQSLRTTSDTRTIQKALDANPVPGDPNYGSSGGEYPFHGGGFSINSTFDWWVQARVFINTGGGARFTLLNGLGGCPLLDIGNFGFGNASGQPYANSCLGSSGLAQANLGSQAFGQWLLVEMVHTTAMNTVNGAGMEFRITGEGINRVISLSSYSGPGSGNPAYLGLAGDAWWDDVRAGYGDIPISAVPLPGAAWLLGPALATLVRWRRRG